MFSERQIADAFAGGRKDSVADRRRNSRRLRFAYSGGRRIAFYQIDARFNRSLVDSRHGIIMEIAWSIFTRAQSASSSSASADSSALRMPAPISKRRVTIMMEVYQLISGGKADD